MQEHSAAGALAAVLWSAFTCTPVQALLCGHAVLHMQLGLQGQSSASHVAWTLRNASPGDLPLQALSCCEGNLVATEAQQHHIMAARTSRVSLRMTQPQVTLHSGAGP